MHILGVKMTMIENEHFNCAKTLSCKVMTIKTQKGIGVIRGIGGLPGVLEPLGASGGVGSVSSVLGHWQGV